MIYDITHFADSVLESRALKTGVDLAGAFGTARGGTAPVAAATQDSVVTSTLKNQSSLVL